MHVYACVWKDVGEYFFSFAVYPYPVGIPAKVGFIYSFSYNKPAYNIFFFCYEVKKNIFAVFSALLINICPFMC
jgi:hypothetical protein